MWLNQEPRTSSSRLQRTFDNRNGLLQMPEIRSQNSKRNQWNPPSIDIFYWKPSPISPETFSLKAFTEDKEVTATTEEEPEKEEESEESKEDDTEGEEDEW